MAARIVAVAQQKGGTGKTTLAAQLAVAWWKAGRRVALIDVDPQASLATWYAERLKTAAPADGLHMVQLSGWRLGTEVDRLRGEYDLVIVDTPPHAETDARVAVRAAELVLVPLQASPMDMWAIGPTLELARDEKVEALLVLNRVPRRGRLADAVRRRIAEEDFPVADSILGNRTAFAVSMAEGRGVVETHPREPAAAELRALADEVAERLGLGGGAA